MRNRCILFLFCCMYGVTTYAATPVIVPINEHTVQVRPAAEDSVVDSIDVSKALYLAVTRQDQIRQFNRLIGVYINIATDSLKKGKPEAAEKLMMDGGLAMLSHYGDGYNAFHAFMLLGKSYHQQKKYTQAKWFFIQANMAAKKIGYNSGQLFSLLELAKVKESIQDNKLALDDYKLAASLASRINFNTTLAEIKKNIVKLNTLQKAADAEIAKSPGSQPIAVQN